MKLAEFKKEIKNKDLKALQRDLKDIEKTYFSEMTHESMREKKNPAKLKKMRKNIAIIKTEIREKVVASLSKESKEEAK